MPRRFAILLISVLLLLAGGLLLVKWLASRPAPKKGKDESVRRVPTPQLPPTPIPPRRVALYFESAEDEKFHVETRDISSSPDDVAFIRAVASSVLDGPYDSRFLRPFPEGWRLRAAFRLKDGLIILDLAPPVPEKAASPAESAAPQARAVWQAGSREEWAAIQSLIITVAKNVSQTDRFALLIGGEPVETLAGHIDLSHPLRPELAAAVDDPAATPPLTPTPTETRTPAPSPSITPTPKPRTPMPVKTPRPTVSPVATLAGPSFE